MSILSFKKECDQSGHITEERRDLGEGVGRRGVSPRPPSSFAMRGIFTGVGFVPQADMGLSTWGTRYSTLPPTHRNVLLISQLLFPLVTPPHLPLSRASSTKELLRF